MPVLSAQKRDSQDSLSFLQTSHYEHKAKSEPGAVATGFNSPWIQQTNAKTLVQPSPCLWGSPSQLLPDRYCSRFCISRPTSVC